MTILRNTGFRIIVLIVTIYLLTSSAWAEKQEAAAPVQNSFTNSGKGLKNGCCNM